jgi:hypothetical protein
MRTTTCRQAAAVGRHSIAASHARARRPQRDAPRAPTSPPARPPAQVGEFCEVSNGSETDPGSWLGRVARVTPKGYTVSSAGAATLRRRHPATLLVCGAQRRQLPRRRRARALARRRRAGQ